MLKNCADCLESNGSEGIFLLSKHSTGPPELFNNRVDLFKSNLALGVMLLGLLSQVRGTIT